MTVMHPVLWCTPPQWCTHLPVVYTPPSGVHTSQWGTHTPILRPVAPFPNVNFGVLHSPTSTPAEQELKVLTGPSSLYERWVQWEHTSSRQADTQLLVEELNRLLKSEPVSRWAYGWRVWQEGVSGPMKVWFV